MSCWSSALVLVSLCASPLDEGAGVELRYSGTLSKISREAEDAVVKRVTVFGLATKAAAGGYDLAFVVDERGGGGWAWPERYGELKVNAQLQAAGGRKPRVLHNYEGNLHAIPLVSPIFPFADKLQEKATWQEDKESYEVAGVEKLQDRDCWRVEVATSFGRKRTIWVQQGGPLVVAAEEKVFMGQGNEHSLKLQLESLETRDQAGVTRVQEPLQRLLALQTELKRDTDETRAELTAAQLKLAQEAIGEIERAAADTPVARLASVISRDVKLQLQRFDEVAGLAKKFVGEPTPKFTLTTTDKTPVAMESLKGQIVVLHFWDYRDEPLVEPYGQVGYLDFLAGRRKKLGVQVYGVAVDPRLAEAANRPAALKSIQKLRSFMNLSYPIATDDGSLLAKFGDPRTVGAQLPLWVVIGADGRVAHYHVGFYKINPDEGLRQLDEALVELIKKRKTESPKP